jgi:DNA-binding transcriptional regulator YbjK
MAVGLQPSQERSRVRREALLRAATELLAEGGTRSLTHRAVAARAGLPQATTTYYFESIQQLSEEALRMHVGERVEELGALAEAAGRGGRTAEEIALRFADSLAGRSREITIAQFEVYLEAARNPNLREAVAEVLEAFEQIAEAALGALGAKRPAEAAGTFVALLDGFAVHRVARPRSKGEESAALFEAMRALFIAYVMDDDELARWHERFRQPLEG